MLPSGFHTFVHIHAQLHTHTVRRKSIDYQHTYVCFNTLTNHVLSFCTAITQLSKSFHSQSVSQKSGSLEMWMSPVFHIGDLSSVLTSATSWVIWWWVFNFSFTLSSSIRKSEFCQPAKHVLKTTEDMIVIPEIKMCFLTFTNYNFMIPG